MTVIGFKSKKDRNQDLMVQSLEHCLALAKAGKYTTLLTIGVLEDRGVQCSCDGDSLEALGALKAAEHRILRHTEDVPPENAIPWKDFWETVNESRRIFGARAMSNIIDLHGPANPLMDEIRDLREESQHRLEMLQRQKAEIERLTVALELIAGGTTDKLQAMQARCALDNIGPALEKEP